MFRQSSRVDRLDAETSRQRKKFEHNFQLVMWTLAILFAVGAHKLMSLFMSATSQTDTFKDKRLRYRVPAEGIREEGVAGGPILASRVCAYVTKDAGRGLWSHFGSSHFGSRHVACARCRIVLVCRLSIGAFVRHGPVTISVLPIALGSPMAQPRCSARLTALSQQTSPVPVEIDLTDPDGFFGQHVGGSRFSL